MYENEPRTVGGVLDAGVRLYRGAFTRVVVTAAKGFAAVFLLEVVFELVFGVSSASLNAADVDAIDPANIAAYLVLVPLSLLISLLTTAAVIVHLHRIATNAPEGDAGVYAAALRRVLPYVGTSILYGIATVLGAILLIVPGVWLSIAFLPAIYLVFTEQLGPIGALRRSFSIVRGNWWRTATIVLVSSFIVLVIQAGIVSLPAFLAGVVAAAGDGQIATSWVLVLNFLNAIAQALSIPLAIAMGLAIVRDLVIRASGEDLEARLDAAAG
ncbi:MAG: hypothetical protein V2J24_18965 [Pseudomonadales bacterium]|jgi:hypothetical protein|nr:hypothetical protein [Pseudomonadales bacterium]